MLSRNLGQWWQSPNSWEKGEKVEKDVKHFHNLIQ